MKSLYLLVKTGLLNQWKLNELKNVKNKRKKRNLILMMVVIAFLGIVIISYAAGSAYGLIYMKMARLIPSAALTAVALLTFLFTIVKTNGILFGYKDYSMLAALPVKTSTLAASRFMQLYFTNLLISILIMLPMGIVYGVFESEDVLFYLMWLISMFAAPLVPTTLATLLGVLIMAAASKMKHSNAIGALLSICLFIGIMIGSMSLGSLQNLSIGEFSQILTLAEDSLFQAYPVTKLFQAAIVEHNGFAFAIFIFGSYLWYRLFIILTALKYQSIQSALTSHSKSKGVRGELNFRARTKLQTLVSKEWKKFLSSNIYLLNMGMGVIMVLLLAVALVLVPEQSMNKILEESQIYMDIKQVIAIFGPFLIAGVLGMSSTACCSLSLEGSNIQQLKALPLKPIEIYQSKIIMNIMLVVPVSLLASLLLAIKFGTDFISVINIFLLPLVFSVFTSLWGMFANIRFPNFDWDNEVIVVKQSAASLMGLLGGMVLALVGGTITGFAPKHLTSIITWIIMAGIAGLCIILYDKIKKSPLPESEN